MIFPKKKNIRLCTVQEIHYTIWMCSIKKTGYFLIAEKHRAALTGTFTLNSSLLNLKTRSERARWNSPVGRSTRMSCRFPGKDPCETYKTLIREICFLQHRTCITTNCSWGYNTMPGLPHLLILFLRKTHLKIRNAEFKKMQFTYGMPNHLQYL